jgi:type I restriction enzyme R subunit
MFLDPEREVKVHKHGLPHWQQSDTYIFITWRLFDSVPQPLIKNWKERRETWLKFHPKPWDKKTEQEYHETFSGEMEHWLDQGLGSCLLRERETAQIVASCLLHDHETLYEMDSFVIMPNHIHLLVLLKETPLEDLMQTWKSVTSHRINKQLKREGSVWQGNYWDRLLRSEAHYHKTRNYIQANPTKAHLPPGDYLLWMR